MAILCLSRIDPIGKWSAAFGLLYTLAFVSLIKLVKAFPVNHSAKRQFLIIFSLAVGCRLLFAGFPLNYDIDRQLWEGSSFESGINSDSLAANGFIFKPLVSHVRPNIHHKDPSGCHPPPAIIFVTIARWIFNSSISIQTLCLLFDLALILILARMLALRAQPLSWLAIYALNPLVILLAAGQGPVEVIPAFFIWLSLFGFVQKKRPLGFLAFGGALVSGLHALVLLPLVVTSKNWKKSYLLLVPALACLPLWDAGRDLFAPLLCHETHMQGNGSVMVILRAVFGAHADWVSFACFLLCLGFIFVTTHDLLRSSFLVLGALLLLMPTLHPRHLVLVTPFLVFFPSSAWIYLHLAMGLALPMVHFQTGAFQETQWLVAFQYIPFYALLIWSLMRPQTLFAWTRFATVDSFSVVIPTLNERLHIRGALESVGNQSSVREIFVVDGGSSDGTQEIAGRWGVKVIETRIGRGHQISAGVDRTRGDVILTLHADCRIREGTLHRIRKALNGNPACVGGAVGMRYQARTWKHRALARVNNGRARLTGISFGDQAQFFRRNALESMGGYPDQMLMEDVELSMRMKKKGNTLFIPDGVVVSERRWSKRGFLGNIERVVTLCLTYLVQRRLEIGDAARSDFYARYYNKRIPP